MKAKIVYGLFLNFMMVNILFSQNKELDSLWRIFNSTSQTDTNRLNAINQLAFKYRINQKTDSAILLANLEFEMAKKYTPDKNNIWLGKALFILGNTYLEKNDYTKGLEYHLKAIDIFKELDNKNMMAKSYGALAMFANIQKDYTKAEKYSLLKLDIHTKIADKNLIAGSNLDLGDYYRQQGKYNLGLFYLNKALVYYKSIGDTQKIMNTYNNLSVNYFEQKKYQNAIDYILITLPYSKQKNDNWAVMVSYALLGQYNCKILKYNNAIAYSDSAKKLNENLNNVGINKFINETFAEAYSKIGNYQKAYECYVLYSTLKDSMDNNIDNNALNEVKSKLENEKRILEEAKQKEILEANKNQQQLIMYSVIGILLVVSVFSILLYKRFKLTNKQKGIIEVQKHLVEEKHKEITDSINYAERIQRSFLATKQLLDENLKDYFVFFQPKDIVSGDFYWASKLSNDNFALVTADSTGHGVPGAIMSLLNITSIESALKDGFTSPSEILNDTRKMIIDRLKKDGSAEGGKDGMDASLICFDFKNNKFSYSAANNPIWIVREKQILELSPDKMPVGKHDKDFVPFTQHEIELQKGDVVYTLTDGMPDQFGGPKGKKFMYKKLKELLVSIAHLPMQEQKETLQTALNNWKGDLEQVDDVCVIGVSV
jgi:serine phosphatase RsbU (regulator of sigma subunit)